MTTTEPARRVLYTSSAAKYMTPQAVGEYFGVSAMSVYRLINNGDLEAVRVGRRIAVSIATVKAHEAANLIEPGDFDSWAQDR